MVVIHTSSWGIDNEENAKKAYCKTIQEGHDHFVVQKLHLDLVGASVLN